MVNFVAQIVPAGARRVLAFTSRTKGYLATDYYQPDGVFTSSKTFRSKLDSLWTSRKRFAGDHDCFNYQVEATASLPMTVSGTGIISWKPADSYTFSTWEEPANGAFFSLSQLQSGIGMSTTSMLGTVHSNSAQALESAAVPYHPTDALLQTSRGYLNSSTNPLIRYGSDWCTRYLTHITEDKAPIVASCTAGMTWFIGSDGVVHDSSTLYGEWDVPNGISYFRLGAASATKKRVAAMYVWDFIQLKWILSTASTNQKTVVYLVDLGFPKTLDARQPFWFNPGTLRQLAIANCPKSVSGFIALSGIPTSGVGTTLTLSYAYGNADDLASTLDSLISQQVLPVLPPDTTLSGDWGDLGDTAMDNTMTSAVNWIENLSDLKRLGSTVRDVISLLKNPLSVKSWANAWLSLRYGDRLLFNDVVATVQDVGSRALPASQEWAFTRSQDSSSSNCTAGAHVATERHLKLYYKLGSENWFYKVYTTAMQWGLWPSTSNCWDLIPFSFVVDWFVDIGSYLEDFDRSVYSAYFDVLSVCRSQKDIAYVHPTPQGTIFSCGITVVRYNRRCGTTLPTSPFRAERGHLANINLLDGAALIVQRF